MDTQQKNIVLKSLAGRLRKSAGEIISANQEDVDAYAGGDEAMYDRLKVNEAKVEGMVQAVEDAMKLADPVGKVLYAYHPENGLRIENRTVPFGRILIIYESRPDVTIEAAVTAFKAGNRILLKGGKEARNTNLVLTELWHQALREHGLDPGIVSYLDMTRAETQEMIRENSCRADLIIPRGGDALIEFVQTHSSVPVIVSGRGNNFLFVDRSADPEMAIRLILNGKSRISVCNALDKVIIHEGLPNLGEFLDQLVHALKAAHLLVLGNQSVCHLCPSVYEMDDEDILYEEFLSAKIMLSLAPGIGPAMDMINTYSGGHSATIVTEDADSATCFMDEVDCAAVYHNASTRFTDGGQFGFGAEMAISTQKLHFRGPVGIGQLVTNKWFVYGTGQTRD